MKRTEDISTIFHTSKTTCGEIPWVNNRNTNPHECTTGAAKQLLKPHVLCSADDFHTVKQQTNPEH